MHLKGFAGILQADGYAGFERLYEGGRISEAACWAHVRRKFYEICESNRSPLAAEALARIGKLYEIEAAIRGRSPDERRAVRQARAGPLLEELRPGSRRPWRRCRRSRRSRARSATR